MEVPRLQCITLQPSSTERLNWCRTLVSDETLAVRARLKLNPELCLAALARSGTPLPQAEVPVPVAG